MQKVFFLNLCEVYFRIYRTVPKTANNTRGPYGHATGWAMRVVKIGASRLADAYASGLVEQVQGNPWIEHLQYSLTAAAKLKRHTVARRVARAWSEIQAADQGASRLLPHHFAGFLTYKYGNSAK